MSKETPEPGGDVQHRFGRTSKRELFVFAAVLLALECLYFSDALRPGFVLSAADWLLATESFRAPGEPEYEPANRLLTDVACQMEPWMDLAAREWQDGRAPLWNPYAGCGAPLLANAQSGVFYPINFIYFLTRSPYAWVAMAMTKLFIAGIGAFLLAREFGLGWLGRWFAGLCFPFSGFVIVWLLYPMGGVAVWLPLVLWLIERLAERPVATRAGWLAIAIGVMVLGGHPETAAHILLVAGLYLLWRCRSEGSPLAGSSDALSCSLLRSVLASRSLRWFVVAVVVGLLLAGVQLVPLAEYLSRSQAWAERSGEVRSVLEFRRPHLLATPALALPYAYGSYLRGHPHVEKALGVENFNEIAGGYAGLLTIAVLVPLSLRSHRRHRWIPFWLAIDLFALAAVYRLPVVDNLIRLIPVLNVTQNQRLLLVVALAHCLLGGAGLEAASQLAEPDAKRLRWLLAGLLAAGAVALAAAGVGVKFASPRIHQKAVAHFAEQARVRGLPDDALEHRAELMTQQCVRFFPRYYFGVAAFAGSLALLVGLARRVPQVVRATFPLIVITLIDLFLFGRNYNPVIPLDRYFPETEVTRFLKVPSGGSPEPVRVLPLEEEFPPNVLGRYGIADLRNYDAIEVRDSLRFFAPLWSDSDGPATSNRWIAWPDVRANSELLRLANVRYIISTRPHPQAIGGPNDPHYNPVRVIKLDHAGQLIQSPFAGEFGTGEVLPLSAAITEYRPGHVAATVRIFDPHDVVVLAETCMPGWRASVDGSPTEVGPFQGAFVSLRVTPGEHRIVFDYDPSSFRWGLMFSAGGMIALASLLIGGAVTKRHR